jgi:tetratricopeptide (TPR) repeat protein
VVLAEADDRARVEKLEAYRERREDREAKLDRHLDALAGARSKPAAPAETQGPAAWVVPPLPPPPPPDPERSRRLAHEGKRALRRGQEDEAELRFEQALAKNTRDPVALAGLRDLYFDRGDYGRAATYAKRVVEIDGRDAEHRLRLGDAYFKIARYEDAETEYAKAVRLGDSRARWRLQKTRKRLTN